MSFSSPVRLLLLVLVAGLAAGYVLLQRRRSRYAVRLPGLDLLVGLVPRSRWRTHAAAALMLVSLGAATAAFADPVAQVKVPRDRATVIVALDVSLSMAAQDVDPDRISAAQAAAEKFVQRLPDRFNVGLVAFAGTASVVVPATQEHDAVVAAIEQLRLGNGTAIGEAVFASLDAVRAVPGGTGDEAAPAHVVLLSDGANTAGRPVRTAAEQVMAAGIPVSTIAYGTPDGTVSVNGQGIRVPVDAPALAELAQQTGGQAYEAASGDELDGVYADIGSKVGYTTETRDVGSGVAGIALLAAVGAGAAALAWSPRTL